MSLRSWSTTNTARPSLQPSSSSLSSQSFIGKKSRQSICGSRANGLAANIHRGLCGVFILETQFVLDQNHQRPEESDSKHTVDANSCTLFGLTDVLIGVSSVSAPSHVVSRGSDPEQTLPLQILLQQLDQFFLEPSGPIVFYESFLKEASTRKELSEGTPPGAERRSGVPVRRLEIGPELFILSTLAVVLCCVQVCCVGELLVKHVVYTS